MDVLNVFYSYSCQAISMEKTSIMFSRNVSTRVREDFIARTGFVETTPLGKYLGIPLTERAPRTSDYHYLIDKVKPKLSGWKTKQLSCDVI